MCTQKSKQNKKTKRESSIETKQIVFVNKHFGRYTLREINVYTVYDIGIAYIGGERNVDRHRVECVCVTPCQEQ